jgi:hypothetical protein
MLQPSRRYTYPLLPAWLGDDAMALGSVTPSPPSFKLSQCCRTVWAISSAASPHMRCCLHTTDAAEATVKKSRSGKENGGVVASE